MQKRQLILLATVWGLLVGAIFWAVKSVVAGMSGPAPVQPDSYIYFQYARAMAENHAYRFTPDQQPSTGSTSHLYPFVLSLLIRAGGIGRIEDMSFIFNICCHALSLGLVALIAWRLKPSAAPLAVLIAGLSGHQVFTTLSDCDMSMFIPVALAVFAAAIHGRTRLLAVLLAVAAWTRPEGMVMSGLLLACAAVAWIVSPSRRADFQRYGIAGLAGVVASMLVLLWNHRLTGNFAFQSVIHKGHFAQFPLSGALILSAKDFIGVWSDAFWGLTTGSRALEGIPVLGAALCIIGFYSRPRDTANLALPQLWWLAFIIAAAALVATSGWAGFMHDRYFGWIAPYISIYMALGVVALADSLRNRGVFWGTAIAIVIFQATGIAYFLGIFGEACAEVSASAEFARDVQTLIPAGTRICVNGGAGLAMNLPGHSIINIAGIVSPSMSWNKSPDENIEKFKHDPKTRFDYWLLDEPQTKEPWMPALLGRCIARQMFCGASSARFVLYEADWSVLDRAGTMPLRTNILAGVAGMKLVDQLDVGHGADETCHHRSVFTRVPGVVIEPCIVARTIETNRVVEVGEAVIGSETFTVRTVPHRPLRVVMRTASFLSTDVECADGVMRKRDFQMESPLRLRLFCGGDPIGIALPINPDAATFDEISFDIPADRIAGEKTEITLGGDHVALAYWFFQ